MLGNKCVLCSVAYMTPNPDEELVYSRAHIESLERRVFEAEERATELAARRAALEVLLMDARSVAVAKRNEFVNGDAYECGRESDPLPWEAEVSKDYLLEVSGEMELPVVPWANEEDDL